MNKFLSQFHQKFFFFINLSNNRLNISSQTPIPNPLHLQKILPNNTSQFLWSNFLPLKMMNPQKRHNFFFFIINIHFLIPINFFYISLQASFLTLQISSITMSKFFNNYFICQLQNKRQRK